MTKSFAGFLWMVSFIVFLVSAWAAGSLVIGTLVSSGWSTAHWIQWLGILVGLSIVIPIIKLLHLREQIKMGIVSTRQLVTLVLLTIWFLVPLFYGFNLDRLWCVEAFLRGIELLPGKC